MCYIDLVMDNNSYKKIFIDISNLISVNHLSGIQRVVSNVVFNLLKTHYNELFLFYYDQQMKKHFYVDKDHIFNQVDGNIKINKDRTIHNREFDFNVMENGNVLFEIDSIWHSPIKRSELYPYLKNKGIKIVAYIYDIIPIIYPQYCSKTTIKRFINYIGAVLQYADHVIASTYSVIKDINELCQKLNLDIVKSDVSWLGVDKKDKYLDENLSQRIKNIANSGKYILYVGTIEPRKNIDLLIEAFDKILASKDIHLILAGKTGWNVDETIDRIHSNKFYNNGLFHLEGLSDDEINYLYQNAVVVVNASYSEGFGLPIVESFIRKIPVVMSDIPTFREVGGYYADYFKVGDVDDFINTVIRYFDDDNFRISRISEIEKYKTNNWEQITNNIYEIITNNFFRQSKSLIGINVQQIVYISARIESIKETLKYVDRFMPFIKKVLLCVPDTLKHEMTNCYEGRLSVDVLTDSELLGDMQKPSDHQQRNTLLRIMSFRNIKTDNVFIMSDDDYHPLFDIDESLFIKDGKFQAYYCYELDKWRGDYKNPTSYDLGMKKTREYLENKKYPLKQYSSHMPQIIDKRIYLEMVDKNPDIVNKGLDEWSIYFNYLNYNYPEIVENKVYLTLNWPGYLTDWDMMYYPEDFVFENYYEELYEKGNVLDGYPKKYSDTTTYNDTLNKISYMKDIYNQKKKADENYKVYVDNYKKKYGEIPSFGIIIQNNKLRLKLPKYLELDPTYPKTIDFFVYSFDKNISDKKFKIRYIASRFGKPSFMIKDESYFEEYLSLNEKQRPLRLPGQSDNIKTKKFILHFIVECDGYKSIKGSITLKYL